MLSTILSLLPGRKLSAAAAVGLAFVLVIYAIYAQGVNRCRLEVAQARAAEQAAHSSKVDQVVTAFQQAVATLNRQNENLRQKVASHVPENPDCDYSRGAVRLLNIGRTGMSEATEKLIDDPATPSTITQQAATEQWLQDAGQCRAWREQLISLIEWHTKD